MLHIRRKINCLLGIAVFWTILSTPLICNLHSVQCRKHVSLLSPLMTFQLMQFCMGKYAVKCFLLFQTEYCRESIHKIHKGVLCNNTVCHMGYTANMCSEITVELQSKKCNPGKLHFLDVGRSSLQFKSAKNCNFNHNSNVIVFALYKMLKLQFFTVFSKSKKKL